MICGACAGDSRITDSRPEDTCVRRRRECLSCGVRWTTYEVRLATGTGRAEMAALVAALDRRTDEPPTTG